jgi:murein hydrolase activator
MRNRFVLAVLASSTMVAASAQVGPSSAPLDQRLGQARAEAEAADAEVRRLGAIASKARSKAAQLRAEQLAAAQAIAAAEARISLADAEIRLISARQEVLSRHLRQQQQPISSLLAGLAMMASRPPLVSLAGAGGTEELVRLRVLVDTTLPVIRARTAGLREQLSSGDRLQRAAAAARTRLQKSRQELASRREQFAELEKRALAQAASSDSKAIEAGDLALTASDRAALLGGRSQQARTAASIAAQLAREPVPPAAPHRLDAAPSAPFPYILPAEAPVLVGLGAVSASGIRSRGITLGTANGSSVAAPASGVVRFSGPFEDYDGVIIIDHGGGWMSLIVNVGTQLRKDDRVELGERIGRAFGPIDVELSRRGLRFSPALIAGSSAPLSNGA